MEQLCKNVLAILDGRTLVTAESLTGGGIGAALTAVPGASAVYKGGVISYVDQVKQEVLGVPEDVLSHHGAVSKQSAAAMAHGVRKLLRADVAVSVTGLAGPTGDDFGNPVGTVFIGFESADTALVRRFLFEGSREEIRNQTIAAALQLVLENI